MIVLSIRTGGCNGEITERPDPPGPITASFLSIHTPGVFGPEFFYDALAIAEPGGGPPDQAAINEVMLRHGLTPVAPPAP